MSLHEIRQKREQILTVAARHGARNLHVFGSIVSPANSVPIATSIS